MSPAILRRVLAVFCLAFALVSAACGGGVFTPHYEYEEELYLALDGSATMNVNASVPALVALRGAELDVNPRARLDRARVRAMFEGPGARVTRVSASRRDGRRFVHVSIAVDDIARLSRVQPFSWSTYTLQREGDVVAFHQQVGKAVAKPVSGIGWTGAELVAFRMHLPSEIPFHNSPTTVRRGNILEWEQPLAERLAGTPLDLEVKMQPDSILYTTLLLFGATVVAALLTFAVVIWWVVRKGRAAEMAESRP